MCYQLGTIWKSHEDLTIFFSQLRETKTRQAMLFCKLKVPESCFLVVFSGEAQKKKMTLFPVEEKVEINAR